MMVCFFTSGMAQYTIPSYNVDVTDKAYFQEGRTPSVGLAVVLSKAAMNIKGHVPNFPSGTPCAQVWVYSLDRQDILGPFDLGSDQIFSVAIDDREWGVYIEVSVELLADVWIGESSEE